MEPTQESTQPYSDPRRLGSHNSGLDEQDVSDIICILHPNSPAAHDAVAATARIAPQHILQRDDLEYDSSDTAARDIALRLSSSVKNLGAGFYFGRHPARCDVLLTPHQHSKHISNMHFRIFVNRDGILMLQDTSTNGTVVDSCRLWKPLNQTSRMLTNGSVITVVSDNIVKTEVRFVVRIPSRDGFAVQYTQNLLEYLERVQKYEANAKQQQVRAPPSQPVLQWTVGNPYGMHWTGGSLYNVTGQIGKGAFATVYKLATKQHGVVYAAKELDKRRFMKNGVLDQKVDNEMKIMRDLRHPNIVQYVDYHEHDRWIYIIMEYVAGGELSTYLQTHGKIAEDMVKIIARQVLHALAYLHKRKITHRDIKPDNILIASLDPLRVKLSDFGLSKVVQEETFLKTFCGTLLYCAPEVYPEYENYRQGVVRKRRRLGDPPPKTSPYDQSVDMWSLGAVLFHILCGSPPYVGRGDDRGAQMLRNIMTTDPDLDLLRREGVSEEGIDFVSRLLNRDPQARPKEQECFQHPWIADVPDIDEYSDDETFPAEQKKLGMIQETVEEELDASQLSIHDDFDKEQDSQKNSQTENEVKRPRLEEAEIRYPSLPHIESFSDTDVHHQKTPKRLFGEVTASALQNAEVLEDLDPNEFSGIDNASSSSFHSSSGESMGDVHGLTAVSSSPMPEFGGSAPSLMGAEALVGRLNMSSSDNGPSNPATPAANTPATPRSVRSREATPANQDLPEANQENSNPNEVTPKAIPLRRRIELPLPDTASESSNQDVHSNDEEDNPKPELHKRVAAELATTIDARTGKEISDLPATSYGATSDNFPGPTLQHNSKTPSTSAFSKPRPLLGKLTTLPGSIFDCTIRLEDRMTSWGRGLQTTVRYPKPMDARIPLYALEITFWKPGMEALIAAGTDWMTIPGVTAILSTKTSKCIWVNGVELRRGPDGREGFQWGKLYTGDIITVYQHPQHRDRYLKFRCEFYHGDSARPRPENEKGFIVRTALMQKTDSSQNQQTPVKQKERVEKVEKVEK